MIYFIYKVEPLSGSFPFNNLFTKLFLFFNNASKFLHFNLFCKIDFKYLAKVSYLSHHSIIVGSY